MKRYSFDHLSNDILEINMEAGAQLKDFIDALNEAVSTTKETCRLWNLNEAIELSSDDVVDFANAVKAQKNPPRKTAVVAPGDVNFGIARQHSVHRQTAGNEQLVFRSRQAALDWLDS